MLYKIKKHQKAIIAIIFLLVFSFWMRPVSADLTNVKDTLSDSRPNVSANHEIIFTLPVNNDISENNTITVTFQSGFDLTNIDYTDIDLAGSTSGDQTLAATQGTTSWGVGISGQVITFTAPSNAGIYLSGGETITIKIGTNAAGGTANAQITNPTTTGTYTIDITANGSQTDTGRTIVAIISGVTVSATVTESLTFSIAGVNSSACTLGNAVSAVTTTATTVPFGTLTANTFKKGCQSLSISTNAGNGYSLTSQETDQLTNGGGDIIPDTTCDTGTCTESTGAAWATATNNGFGHTCFGSDCVAAYSSGSSYRQFASIADSETAQIMQSNAGPVSNSTTTVVYQISVSATQASGDYSNTVVYIATAQFD